MNCTLPRVPIYWFQDEAIIFNWDDIDFSLCTFDATNPMILKTIVLKESSPALTGFLIKGQRMSNVKTATLSNSKYAPAWTHSFGFIIADNDPEAKKRVVDWHETVTNGDVLEYAYDNSIQNIFWIYPKPSSFVNKKIELIYQKNISEVTEITDTFPLNDSYSVAVQEWMLYSLWGGDGGASRGGKDFIG